MKEFRNYKSIKALKLTDFLIFKHKRLYSNLYKTFPLTVYS